MKSVESFKGMVVGVEDNYLYVRCLLDGDNKNFDVKLVDRDKLPSWINIGTMLAIKITTELGERDYEFSARKSTKYELDLFSSQTNMFKGLGNTPFAGK